ncbi:MAG: hemerythrin family protein [Acidobacteria bacterium]|nr:hemerythrin family protein [Acidobacteriota bacterium]
MKTIQWQDDLSIGIGPIDEQHKEWIEHFNRTSEAIASNQTMEQISKTLGFLADYTETHFSAEEKYMQENNYPAFAEHKAKHDELRSTLGNLVRDYQEEGATQDLADAIETLLGNWLLNHIRQVDMKFGAFIAEQK